MDGVLKGAPFDKRLVARSYDGLAIQPLYTRADRVETAAVVAIVDPRVRFGGAA